MTEDGKVAWTANGFGFRDIHQYYHAPADRMEIIFEDFIRSGESKRELVPNKPYANRSFYQITLAAAKRSSLPLKVTSKAGRVFIVNTDLPCSQVEQGAFNSRR